MGRNQDTAIHRPGGDHQPRLLAAGDIIMVMRYSHSHVLDGWYWPVFVVVTL